jgi:hypothetical protein
MFGDFENFQKTSLKIMFEKFQNFFKKVFEEDVWGFLIF